MKFHCTYGVNGGVCRCRCAEKGLRRSNAVKTQGQGVETINCYRESNETI